MRIDLYNTLWKRSKSTVWPSLVYRVIHRVDHSHFSHAPSGVSSLGYTNLCSFFQIRTSSFNANYLKSVFSLTFWYITYNYIIRSQTKTNNSKTTRVWILIVVRRQKCQEFECIVECMIENSINQIMNNCVIEEEKARISLYVCPNRYVIFSIVPRGVHGVWCAWWLWLAVGGGVRKCDGQTCRSSRRPLRIIGWNSVNLIRTDAATVYIYPTGDGGTRSL